MRSKKDQNEYDEADIKFVKEINKIEDDIGDQRVAGGKRVDKYIHDKGGIKYRDRTLESISQHPDIQVRVETLRRWWAYFRTYKEIGGDIASRYPSGRARDYYALSRILIAPILTKAGETQEDARRRVALEVVDWIAGKRKNGQISCAEVDAMVTKVIGAGSADNVIKDNDHANGKPDRRSKVTKAISFEGIKDAVDYMVNFSDPEHLKSGNINNTALCLEFNRVADSVVRLADHLARAGHEAEVRDTIKYMRQNLDELEAKLEPVSSTWAGDSDTGVKIGGDYEH